MNWMPLTCLVVVFISPLVALIKWAASCFVAVPHTCKWTLMHASRLSIISLSFTLLFSYVNPRPVSSWFICGFLAVTFYVFGKARCVVLKSQLPSVARWPGCHQGPGAAGSSWAPPQQPAQGANSPLLGGWAASLVNLYLPAAETSPITDPYL